MGKPKVGDFLILDYADLGLIALLPYTIISPVGMGGNWTYTDNTISILIQNRSGGNIEISTDPVAVNGLLLPNHGAMSWDLGPDFTGSIYAVATAVGPTNVIVAVSILLMS